MPSVGKKLLLSLQNEKRRFSDQSFDKLRNLDSNQSQFAVSGCQAERGRRQIRDQYFDKHRNLNSDQSQFAVSAIRFSGLLTVVH